MIKTLEIKNFKSIKQLKLDCKRVNVFIGEPNTGKSNLLEALGFLSFGYYWQPNNDLRSFIRHERVSNLFYDEELENPVQIRIDDLVLNLEFKDGRFSGDFAEGKDSEKGHVIAHLNGDINKLGYTGGQNTEKFSLIKCYRFEVKENFPRLESGFLWPPTGENLFSLLYKRKDIRSLAGKVFSDTGFKLGLKPQENKLELRKEIEDITISHPYSLASETLQRVVFYLAAIMSNKDSILTFEEPEAHAFPYYTKYLAEVIALDENKNQYFISTHNPYFLEPILEKTPKDEIGIFITYFKDYQTKVKQLSQKELEKIMEIDVFLNLDRFVKA